MKKEIITKGTKKSLRKKILIILTVALIVIVFVLGLLWNHYLNKNNIFAKFETPKGQEVYILGTWHEMHFNRYLNYSMENILNAIEKVQPDVVFMEAREEYFKEYGVMDGPVDMAVVYAYCLENKIPVEMIDWWVVDNGFQSNSTNDKRDDMIFANIDNKLKAVNTDAKVFIVCGATHYHEQSKRFGNNGFNKQNIKNKSAYFRSENKNFQYPTPAKDIWEQRAYFYAYTYPEIIDKDTALDDTIKSKFTDGNHDAFYNQQLEYCELFSNNELYK